jgi:hypothetical protein
MLMGSVPIIAIGAYNGRKMLEINTMADSPCNPIMPKAGERILAIKIITPQY